MCLGNDLLKDGKHLGLLEKEYTFMERSSALVHDFANAFSAVFRTALASVLREISFLCSCFKPECTLTFLPPFSKISMI